MNCHAMFGNKPVALKARLVIVGVIPFMQYINSDNVLMT